MDYFIFLTGLFLLVAGVSCLFLFREDRFWSRWPLLALALAALSSKVWLAIPAFALGLGRDAAWGHSVLGGVFAAAMLGFFLSTLGAGSRMVRLAKVVALALAFVVVLGLGLAEIGASIVAGLLLSITFAGAWRIGTFAKGRFDAAGFVRPLIVALSLTTIVGTCLLPNPVEVCFDLNGEGLPPVRIAFLMAVAIGSLSSMVFCWLVWSPIYLLNFSKVPGAVGGRSNIVTGVILAAAVFTCANGAWLTHWLGQQAYQERASTLLSALHLGADNLEIARIERIRGLEDEVAGPDYAALRQTLLRVREAMPGVRFAYILGLRGGKLVFLVDSEDPANEETFSPPGEPVADYPRNWLPELGGMASFKGPDRDEWGVWFSGCVPVRDGGGKVVALLGIDYPADAWLRPLATRRMAAMVVTLSVALLVASLFSFHIASREAERNLLFSRAETDRLAFVARRTDNAVVITDVQGRIEWVNEGFTKISGYTKEEVLGKAPGSILQRKGHGSDQRGHMRECIRAGVGFETEIVNYRKSGHAYLVHIECQPLVDKQGNLTGFMAIERDVTQIRRSSRLLAAVASTSTSLLSGRLDDAVLGGIAASLGSAANADRCYLFRIHPHPETGAPAMSQAVEWNSGAATAQAHNPALQNFLFEENGYGRWLPELHAGHVITGTVADFPESEQPMLVAQEIRSLVVVPIFTSGKLTGFLGFDACHEERIWENWEISILRSAAAHIGLRQVAQEEADALVLARDEARSAAVAAETANRAKSTFLATMSHEIRNPLNAVIGMASVLETTTLDTQQQEISDTIISSSNFLLDLINDILDYSRIESGNIDLDPLPFALADLCRDAFDVIRPGVRGKLIELICQLSDKLPTHVEGDLSRLRQILVNLLSNAVKFTHEGFIVLTVDGWQGFDGYWNVTFEVRDTGIGITPEALDRLFTPFVQADSSTTRRFGGSGLGLAICKRLIEVMGGQISVTSVPDRGSSFKVSLPLRPVEGPVASRPVEGFADVATAQVGQFRILVAEDNRANQKVIRLLLQRLGVTADLVDDGQQAVVAAADGGYDVIILDLQMPVMDGLEACRRIRGMGLSKRPCIVALTANAFQEDRDAADEAGMDIYLAKPITLTRLRETLAKVAMSLDGRSLPASPEPVRVTTARSHSGPAAALSVVSLINARQLDTFIDLGVDDYRDMLGDVIREVPGYLQSIRVAVEEGNMGELKRRAHSLKGLLSYFGCVAMTARLAVLEEIGAVAAVHAEPLHTELRELWDRSLEGIREWEKTVPSFNV